MRHGNRWPTLKRMHQMQELEVVLQVLVAQLQYTWSRASIVLETMKRHNLLRKTPYDIAATLCIAVCSSMWAMMHCTTSPGWWIGQALSEATPNLLVNCTPKVCPPHIHVHKRLLHTTEYCCFSEVCTASEIFNMVHPHYQSIAGVKEMERLGRLFRDQYLDGRSQTDLHESVDVHATWVSCMSHCWTS